MNRTLHAVGIGLRRGWTEFVNGLRSIQDQAFYLVMSSALLVYLWLNRDNTIGGTDLPVPQFVMPGALAGMTVFLAVLGPAFTLAQEREDGTLLRMLAVPRGILGYLSGQVLLHALNIIPMLVLILVPSALLFGDAVPSTARGWTLLISGIVLGMLATMPIGIAIGALVPTPQKVMTLGMTPIMALVGVSGLLVPLQQMWDWVQPLAQAFPIYWIGHLMRAALLPEELAAVEVAESWRLWESFAVVGVWAIIVGVLVVPPLLRRMSRRQSGSRLADARETATQAAVT